MSFSSLKCMTEKMWNWKLSHSSFDVVDDFSLYIYIHIRCEMPESRLKA